MVCYLCPEVNLSNQTIWWTLADINLSGANLQHTKFSPNDYVALQLRNINFHTSNLSGASFYNVNLSNANLSNATLDTTLITNTVFLGSTFANVNRGNMQMSGTIERRAIYQCLLSKCDI
jgi:uncharacterized protein YjbI with pentapeptide repeats